MDLPPVLTSDRSTDWPARRLELLTSLADHYYGQTPELPPLEILEDDGGIATERDGVAVIRRRLRLGLAAVADRHPGIEVLLWLPAAATCPVPCFVGLNFHGNHSTCPDTDLLPATNSEPDPWLAGWYAVPWTAERRGECADAWPVATICAAGYGVATAFCGDIAPDHPLTFSRGLCGRIASHRDSSWRCIGRWAWGLSAMRLALAGLEPIAADRMAVIGHSRLGKAALWAGAQDEAFALVISNASGFAGASLNRRAQGETVRAACSHFPHWYLPSLPRWYDRDQELPIDAHHLIACVAPRFCAVGSASNDACADPEGEFLGLREAGAAWRLLGRTPIPADASWPAPGEALLADTAYHLRDGTHALTPEDWRHYLACAERVFGGG